MTPKLSARLAILVTASAALVVVGIGVVSAGGDDTPTRFDPVSSGGDLRGNCDEAEHAGDPECAGVATTAPRAAPTTAPTRAPTTVPTTAAPAPPPTTAPRRVAPPAGVDISGPCDEAEHVNDPRCAGVVVPGPGPVRQGVDISGPCDEPEHVNDPRCTGGARAEDHSGRHGGRDDSGHGRHGDDDHDDDSGHGRHGGDDHDDDSGHGRHGGDDV